MRLIDADKLPLDIEHEDIDDAPTVDAVEVVRCKDCKYADVLITGNIYCKHFSEWHLHGTDWFCADGERRDPCSSQDS